MAVPVTWANQILCKIKDVEARIPSLSLPLITTDPVKIKSDVENAIGIAKDWIKTRLQLHFNEVYPTTVMEAMERNNRRIREVKEAYAAEYNIADIDTVVPTAENGIFSDSGFSQFYTNFTSLSPVRPRTFNLVSTPVNGTSGSYAGSCNTGDFLCDFNAYRLYINTGVDGSPYCLSPVWTEFLPENMIDYITNPDALKTAAVNATIVACYQAGIARSSANYDQVPTILKESLVMWRGEYEDELVRATGLLKISAAGDGNLSGFDEEANRTNWYIL